VNLPAEAFPPGKQSTDLQRSLKQRGTSDLNPNRLKGVVVNCLLVFFWQHCMLYQKCACVGAG